METNPKPERGARAPAPQPEQAPPPADMPAYKGEPLDPERGPGLGCFWTQVVLLATLLVLTPLSVVWAWQPWISAALLFAALGVLLFVAQTSIFLMRLVAADRRTRRRPMLSVARKTVGVLEEEAKSEQDEAGS